MKICPRPFSFADPQVNLVKRALERLKFPAPSARDSVFGSDSCQIVAHHACESRISLDRNFSDFPHEFVLKRQCDIHEPIIRESPKWGKRLL